jgi:hypothetical protein
MNIMAPSTALAGIMTFIWPFAINESQLIAIAVIYGYAWQLVHSYLPTHLLKVLLWGVYLSIHSACRGNGGNGRCWAPSRNVHVPRCLWSHRRAPDIRRPYFPDKRVCCAWLLCRQVYQMCGLLK